MALHVSETYVNATQGHGIGESGIYKSYTSNVGELFRSLQREYGRCTGHIYVDKAGSEPVKIGWVFQKRMQYEDANEHYTREVWITLHDAPDTVTREHHYHTL